MPTLSRKKEFTFNKFIWANLRRRPTRTLAGIFSISLGVVLMLVFVGISEGMINNAVYRARNVKADIILQPPGSSLLLALNNSTMPVEMKDKLLDVPGIKYVTPVLSEFNKAQFSMIFGIDPPSFDKVSSQGLIIIKGQMFRNPFECIVDDVFAKSTKVKVGDQLNLMNRDFNVVGVFKAGIAARILVSLKTLQELNDAEGKVSILYIKCTDPRKIDEVCQLLEHNDELQGYNVTKAEDIYQAMSSNLPGLKEFTAAIITIAVIICFIVILLTMYTAVKERTREIGILKSLGASRGRIVAMVLRESLWMTGIGLVVGTGVSVVIIKVIDKIYPTLSIEIPYHWVPTAMLIVLTSGIMGCIYPAFSAARQDPVVALMYE